MFFMQYKYFKLSLFKFYMCMFVHSSICSQCFHSFQHKCLFPKKSVPFFFYLFYHDFYSYQMHATEMAKLHIPRNLNLGRGTHLEIHGHKTFLTEVS